MANNSQSAGGSCLMIAILGILFILGPIEITAMSLTSGSSTVIVSYCLVILAMICCFAFITDRTGKFVATGIIALIYACIFCSWYSTYELKGNYDHGGLGDLIGMFGLTFTLMVPCYLVGGFIEKRLKEYNDNRKEIKKKKLSNAIIELQSTNKSLLCQIRTHKTELKLIKLIENCGGDVSTIIGNKEFSQISDMESRIIENNKKLGVLESELNTL